MGLSLKVFDDTLPNATLPYIIHSSPNVYKLTDEHKEIHITLTQQPPRVIAGLSLPVTRVVLEFKHHTSDDIEKFMQRFMRYFHRGGG